MTIDPSSPAIEAFIRANLPIAPVPTVSEIRLHRAGPKSGLGRLTRIGGDFGSPYWAYEWGGGLALARHVLDHRETVAGRRVLDLGAGSGIVGIAAAMAGAREVVAADIDPRAMAAIRLNAAANGVSIVPLHGDLLDGAPPPADLVLAGDLFYDPRLARRVAAFLERCLGEGIAVLVGDPGRADLPRERLRLIAEYPGPDFGDGDQVAGKRNAVFAFEPASS